MHASFTVTGSELIAGLTPLDQGTMLFLHCIGAPTFINSARLICPNNQNYTVGAGDLVVARSKGDSVWLLYVLSSVAAAGTVSVASYGATGDGSSVTGNVTISSGSPALAVTGASFVATDVGKCIMVPGAGAAGATLATTILAVTDPEHVTLATNAGTALGAVSTFVSYGTDNAIALANAATAWKAMSPLPTLVFPAGIYCATAFPNFATSFGRVVSNGLVRLRYMGVSGTAVDLDGGSSGGGVLRMEFGPFLIDADSGVHFTFHAQAIHHSKISVDARGGSSSEGIGLYSQWCVCTEFKTVVSNNDESSWYSTAPHYGIVLAERNTGEKTAFCYFPNNIIEGVSVGIYLLGAEGNLFLGGTAEGCSNTGLFFEATSNENRFVGTNFEANTTNDVLLSGSGNTLEGVYTAKIIVVSATAVRASIVGGTHSEIDINAGAAKTRVQDLSYNQSGDGSTISDSGSKTLIRDCLNVGLGTISGQVDTIDAFSVGDANYTIKSTDRCLFTSAGLTAPRTWTVPLANSVSPGHRIRIADEAGGISATNTLTLQRSGGDSINAGTTKVLNAAYASTELISNGASVWFASAS